MNYLEDLTSYSHFELARRIYEDKFLYVMRRDPDMYDILAKKYVYTSEQAQTFFNFLLTEEV